MMSLYRSVANAVGTHEALDLARRLAAWHDAMVIHRRRAGDATGPPCDVGCAHEQAESLWREALEVYGERAHELGFLRTFGAASGQQERAIGTNVGRDRARHDSVRARQLADGKGTTAASSTHPLAP